MSESVQPGSVTRFGLISLSLFVAAVLWFCVELFGRAQLASSGQELVFSLRWMVFGSAGLASLGLGASAVALFRTGQSRLLGTAGLILNGAGLLWLYRLFGRGTW